MLASMLDPFILLEGVRDESGALADLRYVEANAAAIAYNQLTREQMIGARLLDLFPGQLEHGPLREYFLTIETGEPTILDDYAYGHEIMAEERRYDIRAAKCGDGIALTWRDVTDRHEAAQRLADSERSYRLLAENSSDVIMLGDATGGLTWVSPSIRSVLGRSPEEVTGFGMGAIIHPDDIPSLREAADRSMTGDADHRYRYRVHCGDGSYRWVEALSHWLPADLNGPGRRLIRLRDIDEQVRAEQDRAASEEMYRLLAENSSDVVFLRDEDLTITWASPACRTVLGVTAADIVGTSINDFVPPEDVVAMGDIIAAMRRTGSAQQYRVRVRVSDGSYRWFAGTSRPITLAGDHERQWVVTLTDIDEQVRAEQDRAASEEMYRLLADNSSDVVSLASDAGIIEWLSPSAEQSLGYRPSDLVGQQSTDYIHPDGLPGLYAGMAATRSTGEDLHTRYRWRLPDGTYRWLEASARAIPDEATGAITAVVSLRDVDEAQRAQQELAASEHRYRLLAENATDVIFQTSDSRTFDWVSESSLATLGWRPEDLVGHSALDFVHPDDVPRLVAEITSSDASGDVARLRSRWRRPDGTYIWVESVGHPYATNDGGTGRIVTIRDVDDEVHAEQDLAEREHLYRLLAENVTDVIMYATADAHFMWASPSAEATLGWTPADLVGHRASEFVHPEDRSRMAHDITTSNQRTIAVDQRYRWRRPDGSYHWVEAIGRPIVDAETGTIVRVVTLREVDAQVRAEQGLQEREELYRLLAENASDVVWQVSEEGLLTWISPSAESVIGRPVDDLLGTPSSNLICPDDRARFVQTVDLVRGGTSATGEFRVCTPDAEPRWMEISLHSAEPHRRSARIATLRDVDDAVRARKGLEFALQHDQDTGLPTRSAMADRIDRALVTLAPGAQLGVLIVGIDLLSDVNDAYGFAADNMVITATATRLATALGRPDLLGRGAGDEFIAILPSIDGAADAVALAERLRAAVRGPLETGGRSLSLTASIGIAVSEPGRTAADLLGEATTALHHAKELGRDRWALADPGRSGEAARRLDLEAAVRAGLDAGEFVPWFQPIVCLTDDSLAGYEALARWQRDGTVREPGSFLDVVVHSQWVTDLDHALVEPSIAVLARQPDDVFVSINVTGLTLARTNYAGRVRESLEGHAVDPHRLHVEVTETMLLNLDDAVLTQMHELASLGVKWYVDDFGTGYSAISHLRDMPVSGLKLDQSFTAGIGRGDATARHLANGLVGLANGLALDTVAEGVETQAEADYLRTLGWKHGQGWLYGRPAPLS
jgi:diguanylate cyclase (GGDEF)-like protein/PAS domain S-box-containing protein